MSINVPTHSHAFYLIYTHSISWAQAHTLSHSHAKAQNHANAHIFSLPSATTCSIMHPHTCTHAHTHTRTHVHTKNWSSIISKPCDIDLDPLFLIEMRHCRWKGFGDKETIFGALEPVSRDENKSSSFTEMVFFRFNGRCDLWRLIDCRWCRWWTKKRKCLHGWRI